MSGLFDLPDPDVKPRRGVVFDDSGILHPGIATPEEAAAERQRQLYQALVGRGIQNAAAPPKPDILDEWTHPVTGVAWQKVRQPGAEEWRTRLRYCDPETDRWVWVWP